METGDLRPIEEWGHDAQWADELHHELHVLLTGEREGYYERYAAPSRTSRASSSARRRSGSSSARRTTTRSATAPFGDRPPRELQRAAGGACSSSRRRRRCSSWARSTASPRRSSSSPTTSTRRSPTRRARAAGGSSRTSRRSPPRTCPTRRPGETFERSKLTRTGDAELRRLYRRAPAAAPRAAARGRDRRATSEGRLCACGAATSSSSRTSPTARYRSETPSGYSGVLRDARSGPGEPFPLGAMWDGEGHELLALLRERASASSSASSTSDDDETRIELHRADRVQLALLPARRRPRPALRLPRPRRRTTRGRATASTRRSC